MALPGYDAESIKQRMAQPGAYVEYMAKSAQSDANYQNPRLSWNNDDSRRIELQGLANDLRSLDRATTDKLNEALKDTAVKRQFEQLKDERPDRARVHLKEIANAESPAALIEKIRQDAKSIPAPVHAEKFVFATKPAPAAAPQPMSAAAAAQSDAAVIEKITAARQNTATVQQPTPHADRMLDLARKTMLTANDGNGHIRYKHDPSNPADVAKTNDLRGVAQQLQDLKANNPQAYARLDQAMGSSPDMKTDFRAFMNSRPDILKNNIGAIANSPDPAAAFQKLNQSTFGFSSPSSEVTKPATVQPIAMAVKSANPEPITLSASGLNEQPERQARSATPAPAAAPAQATLSPQAQSIWPGVTATAAIARTGVPDNNPNPVAPPQPLSALLGGSMMGGNPFSSIAGMGGIMQMFQNLVQSLKSMMNGFSIGNKPELNNALGKIAGVEPRITNLNPDGTTAATRTPGTPAQEQEQQQRLAQAGPSSAPGFSPGMGGA